MMMVDVEEDLDVKSLSVVRIHITPGLLYAAQSYWTQCKPGKGERRGGQLASERVSGRTKLLTTATKVKETLGGEFR
jgi:hypothetical protein